MTMTLNEYQVKACRTLNGPYGKEVLAYPINLAVYALGLAGEAGEVVDLIKKEIGHGHHADPKKVMLELGDVLWSVATIAHTYGFTMEDVAMANNAKLDARYPNGFESKRSINRASGDAVIASLLKETP